MDVTKDVDDHNDHGNITITLYLTVTADEQQQGGGAKTSVPLQISSIITSKALRLAVSTATTIPISSLKLIYRGSLIADDDSKKAVEEFKLEEGSVLHCMGKPVKQEEIAAPITTGPAAATTSINQLLLVDGTSGKNKTNSNNNIQAALDELHSHNNHHPPHYVYQDAVQALNKIISNITTHPMESKYRKIKMQNANFHRRLGGLQGGDAIMKAVGFTVELDGGSDEQVYMMRPSPEAWPRLLAIQAAVQDAVRDAANAAQATSSITRGHAEEEVKTPMGAAAAVTSADAPSAEVLDLWNEVGNGLETTQTVVWKSAVESLDHANRNLQNSEQARIFLEKYMTQIIGILVEQQPSKIGFFERECVQDSLSLAVDIITQDLEIQICQQNGECRLLSALAHVFNKRKPYYKARPWNDSTAQSLFLPEIRMNMIHRFRKSNGFRLLHTYMVERIGTPAFPAVDHIHQILSATGDAIVQTRNNVDATMPAGGNQDPSVIVEVEDDAITVANAVMQSINNLSDEDLKKMPVEQLQQMQMDLKRIYDKLAATRHSSTRDFYAFWRGLALRLITNPSLPLKLFGWELVNDLIAACAEHRPPPRFFIVTNAGCPFVNGKYDYAGPVTSNGYATFRGDVLYVRKIPEGQEQGGHKLTLFRCTMHSSYQKRWFLSEADEEQPGTDRDIDYYQHKSKEHEEGVPPPRGWTTCRSAGMDPPPHLKQHGCMVPPGEEHSTLEHQLAKWAIDNNIVEQVLGDTTTDGEVVARCTSLIKFLAQMCSGEDILEPNKYCLQASHLLLAWKTCTRKTDAAVATQVYQLLVSMLPRCPSDLGVPLLKAVQESLTGPNKDNDDYLFEVGEFCGALASENLVGVKNGNGSVLTDEVREGALNLLWSVLTQPDAAKLRSYYDLKRYVTLELRLEPEGSELRERFLQLDITVEDDAIMASGAFMQSINNMSDDDLKEMPMDQLIVLQKDLKNISHKLLATRRSSSHDFYAFSRGLALRLINNPSLPLKLFGWECVSDLIDACIALRPPPRFFVVTNAGLSFVNGKYDYAGPLTLDGYAKPRGDIRYVRKIPEGEEHGGHRLTIFRRCTMGSHQKWWFLSEVDEEQPGTDRDINYYQHKSREHEAVFPPPRGWWTRSTAGSAGLPPPHLKAHGYMVPPGEEEDNTLEHQLAKWAIDNQIVEQLVLGDTTIHREEVVARSKALIKFFAHMCRRDDDAAAASEVFLSQLLAMASFRV